MTEPDTAQQFQVRTNPRDGSPARVLFQGTETDARAYVETHFPRVHVEPGTLYPDDEGPQPDAVMVKPGSGSSADRTVKWDGAGWSDEQTELDASAPVATTGEGESEQTEPDASAPVATTGEGE